MVGARCRGGRVNAAAPALAWSSPARAGPGARQTDPGTMRAWDREWKRAEVAAWFRGTPPAPEQRTSDNAIHGRSRVDAAADASQPSFITTRPHSAVAIRPISMSKVDSGVALPMSGVPVIATKVADALSTGAHTQTQAPHANDKVDLPTVAMSSTGVAPRASTNGKAPAAPVPRATNPLGPEPARAVHVHIERAADGVRVWLGIPGSEQGTALSASALVVELRRSLAAQGYRLSSVICNGEEQS